jgi:DNA-binding SARP family transcriptional activator/tetratricopeptide (TPR) repeat protein
MTPAMLEIRVIGELEVQLAGTKAELPASRRVRALLGWLAVHPGRHPRSRLAGQFWPDVLDASARASLRSAIWALRSALGPDFGSHLATDRDTVTLAADGLLVDLQEVRRLIEQGQPAAALGLCRGDLLQELDDDWVVEAREELDRDIAAALRDLMGQAMAAGDPAAAVVWARRRAALCPLDESAGADLIAALVQAGDASGALEALAKLRDRLDSELGIGVSAETAALVSQLRRTTGRPGQVGRPGDRPGEVDRSGDGPGEVGRPADRGRATAERAVEPAAGLVGRDQEFAELAQAWQAARSGSGGAVLLDGEGGIGKTRLVEELQATARLATPDVLIAGTAAAGPGQAAPFAIWTDALSDLMSMTGHPPGDQTWTADLARIVPALARGKTGAGPAPRPGADPQLDRVRLCEAVVQCVAWVSRQAPLLLAFEDLHLADTASLELIAYAGRRLSRMPVLLVLTRRRLPARQDLDGVLGALRSRGALVTEVEVRPLADAAARALIRDSADLPAGAVEQIVTLAAGSPLLAVETARAAARDDTDLAAGLSGAARLAISRLSGQARMFVEFLAAAGRDLDRPEVASLPLRSPARAAAEALGSGLLRADDGRTGFRHALLRDAVYQEIPDPIRARLHNELAQLLRKRGQQPGSRAQHARGSRRGPRAAEVARHLRLAGQDEQAVSHLVLAAHDARFVAAMAEAAGFLAEAAAIEPDDPDLLVELAEVEAFRGLLESSDAAFDRAIEQISPQDAGALISAWLRRGRWLRGGVCHPRESRRSYRSALDVLDRDPASDLTARAEALTGMAWAEAVAGDPATVDELLAEADRILGGDLTGDLLAHDIGVARGHALIRAGRFADSFGPLIAASAAAGRAGRPDMAYGCLSNAASAAACAGEFGRALDFADRCLPLVAPNGLLRLSVYAQTARSAILRRLGRLPEARQACDAAAGYADRVGLPELDGLVRQERGLLALAAGDPAGAVAELASALDLDAPVSRAATRLRLAEALAASGQADRAESELRNVVLEPVTPSDFPAALVARMSRVQALIASARGDAALAEERLAESVAGWQRIARTQDSAHTGAGYVATLIDLGRPPVSSLVEPARELAIVSAELSAVRDHQAGTATELTSAPGRPGGQAPHGPDSGTRSNDADL